MCMMGIGIRSQNNLLKIFCASLILGNMAHYLSQKWGHKWWPSNMVLSLQVHLLTPKSTLLDLFSQIIQLGPASVKQWLWGVLIKLYWLLGKWLWHFGIDATHLWRQVIDMKYGEDSSKKKWNMGEECGGWTSSSVRAPHGFWRSICVGWDTFQ